MKRCTQCGLAKPLSEFYRHARSKDGLYYHCKQCAIARSRRWTANNAESVRANLKRYRSDKAESISEYSRQWYADNRERKRQSERQWRLANAEARRTADHRRESKKRNALGSHTTAEWLAIVAGQRERCAGCGRKTKLARDHIIPLSRGGSNFAFNIQGLCKPCNCRKHARILAGSQHSLFDNI